MLALNAAEIGGDLALELRIGGLAEIMLEQHVFGRDGRVGFELEHPMTVGLLQSEQRSGGGRNVRLEPRVDRRRPSGHLTGCQCVFHRPIDPILACCCISWAARLPERIAPSMVAGRPVAVQSPASTRLSNRVTAAGRRGSCSGSAANVARRSLITCHCGIAISTPITLATSFQISAASFSRGTSSSRSAPLIVIESRSGNAKI